MADGERGGLIGPNGDVAWMCAPAWHSDSVFDSLIGGVGYYAVTPSATFTWGGYYEPGGLIWRNRWVTTSGVIECRDALAQPARRDRAVLIRRIESPDEAQEVTIELSPVHGFGADAMTDIHRRGQVWEARVGSLYMRWQGPDAVRKRSSRGPDAPALWARRCIEPGDPLDLVLEISDRPWSDPPPAAEELWSATEGAWTDQVPSFDGLLDRRASQFDYAVMRGLTSSGGGMVAAATTSLPERAAQGRNYDYRYVWVRDQAYAGQAAAAAGATDLMDAALSFITARLYEHGPTLAPAYTVDGRPIPSPRTVDLPGYPGGFDVVGNRVRTQFQLDAFGEALLLMAAAVETDRATTDTIRAAHIAADAIDGRWREPDAGIWEVEPQHWTHSRLTCVAGLRRMARAVQGADPATAGRWTTQADGIAAETARTSLHPEGRWQRHPADPAVDAALLLPPLRGAFDAADPRSAATLEAVLSELTEDGYAYRFRHDGQPLAKAEGSFVLCGFLVAMALHQEGREVEAARWFERTSGCAGPPGVYAEEWDVHERQLRGNLPQAFVHALHLEAASRLARPPSPGSDDSRQGADR